MPSGRRDRKIAAPVWREPAADRVSAPQSWSWVAVAAVVVQGELELEPKLVGGVQIHEKSEASCLMECGVDGSYWFDRIVGSRKVVVMKEHRKAKCRCNRSLELSCQAPETPRSLLSVYYNEVGAHSREIKHFNFNGAMIHCRWLVQEAHKKRHFHRVKQPNPNDEHT